MCHPILSSSVTNNEKKGPLSPAPRCLIGTNRLNRWTDPKNPRVCQGQSVVQKSTIWSNREIIWSKCEGWWVPRPSRAVQPPEPRLAQPGRTSPLPCSPVHMCGRQLYMDDNLPRIHIIAEGIQPARPKSTRNNGYLGSRCDAERSVRPYG